MSTQDRTTQDALAPTGFSKTRLLVPGQDVLDGRFRIVELLGVGGMGEVYLAEQRSLGRQVALKVLTADMSLVPGMRERFRREALLLSSVDHPSVVRVIDFGEWAGCACLVMDLVRGESLDLVARAGPLPPARALTILTQLAQGLAAIHAAGIIHRDLKLENVLLAQTALGEQAKLLDFGIARLAEADGAAAATQAGVVIGTPEYMSPEQALGRPLDARSDLYSYGLIAYRLLSGASPFTGPTARDYLLQHISAPPRPLLEAAPQLASHPALARLVSRCLEKEPKDRPAGAAEVVEALGAADLPAPAAATREVPAPATPGGDSLQALQGALRQAAQTFPGVARETGGRFVQVLRRRPRWLLVAAAGAAAMLLLGLAVRARLDSPERTAARQLQAGDAPGALATLRAARAGGAGGPRGWVLEARALHALGEHGDEWAALEHLPASDGSELDEPVVQQLLQDFVSNDDEPTLRAQLERVKQSHLDDFKAAATGSSADLRWSAARLLDAWALAPATVVDAWIGVLGDESCARRAVAARRLGELGDDRASAPLERLKATPKRKVLFFEESCGHAEAELALQKLAKKRADRAP